MKKMIAILCMFAVFMGWAQHSTLDSVTQLFENATTDSARCYNRVLLASEYANSNIDTSVALADRALADARKLKSDLLVIKALAVSGYIYGKQAKTEQASAFLYEGLRLAEKITCNDCVAYIKNELALLEMSKMNFRKALLFLQEALRQPLEQLADRTKFKVYQNAGLCYNALRQPDSAMTCFQTALPLVIKLNNPYARAMLLNNIAIVYHLRNQYEPALESYRQVSDIGRAIANYDLGFLGEYNTGDIYLRQGKYEAAIRNFTASIPFAEKLKREDYLLYAYGGLLQASEKKGDTREALRYFHLYDSVKDSANLKQNNKNVAELETRYQTEKKESQIRLQNLELNQKNAALFRQRSYLFALAVGVVLLVVFGYLFYNRYRLRQKQVLNEALIKEQQLGLSAVIEAQENERKRIAKDLHDSIAQELVAIKMGFTQIKHPEPMDDLVKALDDACASVRTISHVMSPPMLENKGLPGSLSMLLRNSVGLAGIQHEFETLGLYEKMDEKIEIGLYRIAQELLNNIIKHAKASHVVVQLQKLGTQLILRVEDDGRGFHFETARSKGSMGLLNILSRVRNLNGSFTSEPATPSGTISIIRLPVQ